MLIISYSLGQQVGKVKNRDKASKNYERLGFLDSE